MKYHLICELQAEWFNKAVNHYIENGWKLKGETFKKTTTSIHQVTEDGQYKHFPLQTEEFCQAMVKYEEGEKE